MFVARVGGVTAALLLALALVVHGAAAEPPETVRVEAGDTMWAIAEQRYPNSDTRAKVDEMMRLNGRHDPSLHPGETLKVPRR